MLNTTSAAGAWCCGQGSVVLSDVHVQLMDQMPLMASGLPSSAVRKIPSLGRKQR